VDANVACRQLGFSRYSRMFMLVVHSLCDSNVYRKIQWIFSVEFSVVKFLTTRALSYIVF